MKRKRDEKNENEKVKRQKLKELKTKARNCFLEKKKMKKEKKDFIKEITNIALKKVDLALKEFDKKINKSKKEFEFFENNALKQVIDNCQSCKINDEEKRCVFHDPQIGFSNKISDQYYVTGDDIGGHCRGIIEERDKNTYSEGICCIDKCTCDNSKTQYICEYHSKKEEEDQGPYCVVCNQEEYSSTKSMGWHCNGIKKYGIFYCKHCLIDINKKINADIGTKRDGKCQICNEELKKEEEFGLEPSYWDDDEEFDIDFCVHKKCFDKIMIESHLENVNED